MVAKSMPGMKIWAREHYDWSRRGIVSWRVVESNFCTPGRWCRRRAHRKEEGERGYT
jgi:hypothetical protein